MNDSLIKNSNHIIGSNKNDADNYDHNDERYEWKLKWTWILPLLFGHLSAIYGVYLGVYQAQIKTLIFYFILIQFGATGIICGAHRLWTHRSYRAHYSLRVFLMICQTLAFQLSILQWSLYHRVHHKFSDTDADPHNAKRGFFFAHMGWIMVEHHVEYERKSVKIDINDLKNDSIVAFQHRYYLPLSIIITFILPTILPVVLWNETLINAIHLNIFRIALSLHQTALVNSAAHIYGYRPYDKRIDPSENKFTTYVTMGEAYHNYHHAFPMDYSASEFLWDTNYNPMTAFIDICAYFNLAWNRKKIDQKLIEQRLNKYGDLRFVDIRERKPKNLFADTFLGILTLFWALWVILFIRFIVNHF